MPFKDKLKQLFYMREYQAKRRAERKKQEQLREAHVQAIKIMRKYYVGRECMSVRSVPQDVKDLYVNLLSIPEVGFPIISKIFELGRFETLRKATLAMVEAEDKLLLVGEHVGWPAMGIHGLATAPNHQVVKFNGNGDLVFDLWKAFEKARKKLRSNEHFPPYTVILNNNWPFVTPFKPWPNTSEDLTQIWYSPFLCNSKGKKNNALVVKQGADNFEVLIAHDLDISRCMHDNKANIWEALTPVIHKPSSICEITNIKYS